MNMPVSPHSIMCTDKYENQTSYKRHECLAISILTSSLFLAPGYGSLLKGDGGTSTNDGFQGQWKEHTR